MRNAEKTIIVLRRRNEKQLSQHSRKSLIVGEKSEDFHWTIFKSFTSVNHKFLALYLIFLLALMYN